MTLLIFETTVTWLMFVEAFTSFYIMLYTLSTLLFIFSHFTPKMYRIKNKYFLLCHWTFLHTLRFVSPSLTFVTHYRAEYLHDVIVLLTSLAVTQTVGCLVGGGCRQSLMVVVVVGDCKWWLGDIFTHLELLVAWQPVVVVLFSAGASRLQIPSLPCWCCSDV